MKTLQPDTRIHNPMGVRVQSAVEVCASPADAWKIVGNFGNFERFILALKCTKVTGEGLGQVRNKTFKDGGFAIEQLNSYDTEAHYMTWTLIHTSLPVSNLWAAMEVERLGDNRARAIWTIQAEPKLGKGLEEPAAFSEFLQGFADGAMAKVKQLLS